MNPWTARTGCFGWFMICSLCSVPFYAIGIAAEPAFAFGAIIGSVVVAMIEEGHRRARVREMRDAQAPR
jgi:hypothetical protein